MKRLLLIFTLVSLSLVSCNNDAEKEKVIDSINQAKADSLLNDALQDTVVQENNSIIQTNSQ